MSAAPPTAALRALEAQLHTLVTRAFGRDLASIEWLPAGLGPRRFARLRLAHGEPRSLIARCDAAEDPRWRPAGVAPEPPLEGIRAHLEAQGLPVPRRFAQDADAGIELLEDIDGPSLAEAARRAGPAERNLLYAEACALLPRLQRVPPAPLPAFERRLDASLFAYKADLFARHALGRPARCAERAAIDDAFARIARCAAEAPQRLAHRDFQSANLLLRRCAPVGARIVMIDLQGAFLAPPEYDAVCLLRDSYVEIDEAELAAHCEHLRPRLPDAISPDEFALRFDLLTLSRKGKDLARFRQAAAEHGDPRFLLHVPATLRALRRAAQRSARRNAAFAALTELIESIAEPRCAA